MPFEWFVALRYLRAEKAQTALILAAVSVGVSVIVFLSALIGGLQASLIEKTLGFQPHITLHVPREAPRPLVPATPSLAVSRDVQSASQRLRSIAEWPEVLRMAERASGVTAASPMLMGGGFAVHADTKETVVIRGVDSDRFPAIVNIDKKMVRGRFDVSGDIVAIGSTLAANLGVGLGDKLRITSTEGVSDVVTVGGLFTFGTEAVDRTWLITSLRHAEALFALPGGATQIELKVSEVFLADEIAGRLQRTTGLDADSWMKLNRELLAGLSAQSSSKLLIQFFVVLAVALGIASVLIVSVVQKSREIGILRAVGTPSRRILLVFLIQGGVLGLFGSCIGGAFGALLSKLFEGAVRSPDRTPKFPVDLDTMLFVSATALATSVGLLSAVIPARRASHMDPATAIRNA